ncbi:hypothetical protein POVCU2_0046640 [Plasmodium ovale curtisi]|uniref:Uncharacterized protein n=1 Tax=Plasmodium ovale curtisi TaxID=864141 RepID=A0A1A8WAB0_PLAOA|nr:hypothetical protein POVCU2_0046640 [Plasmodium ovale curtisi]SBS98074.1 hypothetical protein POVCU1_043280 [Plasmodium ovale curtisi]
MEKVETSNLEGTKNSYSTSKELLYCQERVSANKINTTSKTHLGKGFNKSSPNVSPIKRPYKSSKEKN